MWSKSKEKHVKYTPNMEAIVRVHAWAGTLVECRRQIDGACCTSLSNRTK